MLKHKSMKLVLGLLGCGLLLFNVGAAADEGLVCPEDIYIEIVAAPNVLNLQSAGQWVTIHTDIPFSLVGGLSWYLNGIPISVIKSDALGYFVGKFVIEDVKDEVVEGWNTLTLIGTTLDEPDNPPLAFCGSCEIRVINVQATGR